MLRGRFARRWLTASASLTLSSQHPIRCFSTKPGRLAIVRPDLAKQWHPTKNDGKKPSQFLVTATDDAWWRCPDCSHEWQQSIAVRVNAASCGGLASATSTCPECARRSSLSLPFDEAATTTSPTSAGSSENQSASSSSAKAAEHQPLSQTHKDFVETHWDTFGNGALSAADVASGSLRTVWWRSDAVPGYCFRRRVRDHVADPRCPTVILRERLESRRGRALRVLQALSAESDVAAKYLTELEQQQEKADKTKKKDGDDGASEGGDFVSSLKKQDLLKPRVSIAANEVRSLLHSWNATMVGKSEELCNINGHVPSSSPLRQSSSSSSSSFSSSPMFRRGEGRRHSATARARLPVLHLASQHYALDTTLQSHHQSSEASSSHDASGKTAKKTTATTSSSSSSASARQEATELAHQSIQEYQAQLHFLDAVLDEVTATCSGFDNDGGDAVLSQFSVLGEKRKGAVGSQ